MLPSGHRQRIEMEALRLSAQHPLRPVSATEHPPRARRLVAGYGGSARSRAAVAEAGRRAGPSGCVFVVYAYRIPATYRGLPHFAQRVRAIRADGECALVELLKDAETLPPATYVPKLVCGSRPDAIRIVATARNAGAILVGRSRRRVVLLGLGVSRRLTQMTSTPVITVASPASTAGAGPVSADAFDVQPKPTSTVPPVWTWW